MTEKQLLNKRDDYNASFEHPSNKQKTSEQNVFKNF